MEVKEKIELCFKKEKEFQLKKLSDLYNAHNTPKAKKDNIELTRKNLFNAMLSFCFPKN